VLWNIRSEEGWLITGKHGHDYDDDSGISCCSFN
jgi:hypothetical protein